MKVKKTGEYVRVRFPTKCHEVDIVYPYYSEEHLDFIVPVIKIIEYPDCLSRSSIEFIERAYIKNNVITVADTTSELLSLVHNKLPCEYSIHGGRGKVEHSLYKSLHSAGTISYFLYIRVDSTASKTPLFRYLKTLDVMVFRKSMCTALSPVEAMLHEAGIK